MVDNKIFFSHWFYTKTFAGNIIGVTVHTSIRVSAACQPTVVWQLQKHFPGCCQLPVDRRAIYMMRVELLTKSFMIRSDSDGSRCPGDRPNNISEAFLAFLTWKGQCGDEHNANALSGVIKNFFQRQTRHGNI